MIPRIGAWNIVATWRRSVRALDEEAEVGHYGGRKEYDQWRYGDRVHRPTSHLLCGRLQRKGDFDATTFSFSPEKTSRWNTSQF